MLPQEQQAACIAALCVGMTADKFFFIPSLISILVVRVKKNCVLLLVHKLKLSKCTFQDR